MTDTMAKVSDALAAKLTSDEAVEALSAAIRANAFEFDADDQITIDTAKALEVKDVDDYKRGYDLLDELGALDERIADHYHRFDKPLLTLTRVVQGLKRPQVDQVGPTKQALSQRLGKWKAESDRLDRLEAERKQREENEAAAARQKEAAEALKRIAETEEDEDLREAFTQEAAAVASTKIAAAPVEVRTTAPKVAGHSTTRYKCDIGDLKKLLQAWIDEKCHLDADCIIEALGPQLNKEATRLRENMGKAYPGTTAVPIHGAVSRRR